MDEQFGIWYQSAGAPDGRVEVFYSLEEAEKNLPVFVHYFGTRGEVYLVHRKWSKWEELD